MSLADLRGFFEDDDLNQDFDEIQINEFYLKFIEDFVTNPFQVNGKTVKIIMQHSRIAQYANYCESFVHIITRKYKCAGGRIYAANRANRIHWIKRILQGHPSNEIYYYKWKDEDGICKEHYWYFAKDFMVVLKDIGNNVQIVTSFCVDPDEKFTYYERYTDYRDGKGNC